MRAKVYQPACTCGLSSQASAVVRRRWRSHELSCAVTHSGHYYAAARGARLPLRVSQDPRSQHEEGRLALTCANLRRASPRVAGPSGSKLPVDIPGSRTWERDACKSIPAPLAHADLSRKTRKRTTMRRHGENEPRSEGKPGDSKPGESKPPDERASYLNLHLKPP